MKTRIIALVSCLLTCLTSASCLQSDNVKATVRIPANVPAKVSLEIDMAPATVIKTVSPAQVLAQPAAIASQRQPQAKVQNPTPSSQLQLKPAGAPSPARPATKQNEKESAPPRALPMTKPTATDASKVHIIVDIDLQKAIWTGNGISKTFQIATGKPGTETPTGNLRVIDRKGSDHTSTEFKGAKMPYMLILGGVADDGREVAKRGIGMHGVKLLFGGDYPASHGCIRMKTEDAKWLNENTPIDTPVKISGSARKYLSENRVMPWDRPGAEHALEKVGSQWVFKKPMTPQGAKFLAEEIKAKRLGICKRKKTTDQNEWFANFPDINELGYPTDLSIAECRARYHTYPELLADLKAMANFDIKKLVAP